MVWSDGEPATCEDARWTYQFVLDAVASETGYVGSGYLEPYLTNAGLKTVTCTDTADPGGHDGVPAPRSSPRPTSRSCPSTSGPSTRWSRSATRTPRASSRTSPPSSAAARTRPCEWEPGEFIKFARNDKYWGKRGVPDEIIFQTFSDPVSMVPALKSGELDYVRGIGADQFDALKNEPNIKTVEGFSNGYTYLSFNTRGNQKGYNGSTSALADVKFRDALGYAIDHQKLVDAVFNGHARAGDDHVPPYHVKWHVEPATPRTLRHRGGQPAPRCRRLRPERGRQPGGQGGQGDRPPPDLAGLRGRALHRRPVHPGLVQGARDRRRRVRDRGGQALRGPPRSRGRRTPPTGTSTCGAGPATRTRCPCCRSSRPTTSSPASTTASSRTRATTSCSSSSSARPTRPAAAGVHRRDAADLLRRGRRTTSCTTTASSTPTGPTSSAAGPTSRRDSGTPLFGYGYPGYLTLTNAAPASPSPVGGAAGRGAVRERRRRRRTAARRDAGPVQRRDRDARIRRQRDADPAGRRGRSWSSSWSASCSAPPAQRSQPGRGVTVRGRCTSMTGRQGGPPRPSPPARADLRPTRHGLAIPPAPAGDGDASRSS